MKITQTKHGVLIEVFVKPNSHKFKIIADNDEITIYSTEEPIEGKVNKEIIKEFSRLFHKQVELVSGSSSKQKKLFVKSATKKEVEGLLKSR